MQTFKSIRVAFTKTGRLKYISHLDVNRLMQRTLKKAGVPVWYTEGFNPHMYLTFALPLSLGAESDYELMDFRITEEMPFDEIVSRLNAVMPDGMRALYAAEPVQKPEAIGYAVYRIELLSDALSPDELLRGVDAYLARPEILVEKKTKRKGVRTVDIRPDLLLLDPTAIEGGIGFTLTLPAGGRTVNPSLVLDDLCAFLAQTHPSPVALTRIRRTAILNTDGALFR